MHSDMASTEKLTRLAHESQGQEQLITALVHEFRNMMAPLDAALEILELGRDDPLVVDRALPVARRQVRRLCHLMNDLVDGSDGATEAAGPEPAGGAFSLRVPSSQDAPPVHPAAIRVTRP